MWTRGSGCFDLAEILDRGVPTFGGRNPFDTCIEARADLLVERRLTSFDLVDVAVPCGFTPARTGSVMAVAGGPDSDLAARIAETIGGVWDVPATLVYVSRHDEDDSPGRRTLDRIADATPGLVPVLLHGTSVRSLLDLLDDDTLLVIGAPGGSWLQRQLFGPCPELQAPTGAGMVVVRATPPRCFQRLRPAPVLSPRLHAGDARRLAGHRGVLPVVDRGRLIGVIRLTTIRDAPDDVEISSYAEDSVFLWVDDPLDVADRLRSFFDDGPIPVVDRSGRYAGSLPPDTPLLGLDIPVDWKAYGDDVRYPERRSGGAR